MPRRIHEDHKMFRDVVGGTLRKELKKWINSGRILRRRGKNGKISIPIPRIDLPHFSFGAPDEGVGRGPGQPGDKVGEDPGPSKGGNGAGKGEGETIEVDVDMQEILDQMAAELELPNLKQRTSDMFEEIKIKYTSLSRIGPQSLLHKKKTLLQTLKRMSSSGELSDDHKILLPGFQTPIIPLLPMREDMRFRQWREIKVPTSNAVIFFARDISGSMTPFKCDIVSDMSWWIDCWIQQFYNKVERCYVVHDTVAKEVDEKKFYKMRMGGGTQCSSAMRLIAKQLKHRYPPEKWNVYIFYFSDGDNYMDDNKVFGNVIAKELGPDKVNLVGLTEILPSQWPGSGETLNTYMGKQITAGKFNNQYVRTTGIVKPNEGAILSNYYAWDDNMEEGARNAAIKNAIKELLGAHLQSFAGEKNQAA